MNAFSRLRACSAVSADRLPDIGGRNGADRYLGGSEIQQGVISGTRLVTDMYLDGAISPHVQSLATGDQLDDAERVALDRMLSGTHRGEHIVALEIWGRNGRILYDSADPSAVGTIDAMVRPGVGVFRRSALARGGEGRTGKRVKDQPFVASDRDLQSASRRGRSDGAGGRGIFQWCRDPGAERARRAGGQLGRAGGDHAGDVVLLATWCARQTTPSLRRNGSSKKRLRSLPRCWRKTSNSMTG